MGMAKLEKRRDSDGRIRFSFRYIDVDGSRKRHTPDVESEHEALRIMAEVRARIARGIVGVPDERSNERQQQTLTLRELHERFQAEGMPRSKDPKAYKSRVASAWKHLLPVFGERPALGLTRAELRRFHDRYLSTGGNVANLNWILSGLSGVWRWAQATGLLPESAELPVRGLFTKIRQGSLDFFSAVEIERLLDLAESGEPTLFPMIAAAVYSGMRKGELFGLRWPDINPTAGTLRIARSYASSPKNGKARTVPIHPALAPILAAWRRDCPATVDALVFPVLLKRGRARMGTKDDGEALFPLLERAGCHVPDNPWHALRHTFASHYIMNGGNLIALQQLLGHHDVSMTMIYAHLAPHYHAQDLARLTYATPPAQVVPITTAPKRSKRPHAA